MRPTRIVYTSKGWAVVYEEDANVQMSEESETSEVESESDTSSEASQEAHLPPSALTVLTQLEECFNFGDNRKEWIKSLGFKFNTVSHFKAWIMYMNDYEEYGPDALTEISSKALINLKEEHDYDTLKKDPRAPWHKFLYTC